MKILWFTAPWCSPCRAMHPIWDKLKGTVVGVEFVAVDIDQEPALASAHKIQAIPTFVFLKNGVELRRITGSIREQELTKIINELVAEKQEDAYCWE